MEIEISSKGSFKDSQDWLARIIHRVPTTTLNQIGRDGVAALERATPKDTGETSSSWTYKLDHKLIGSSVSFYNNAHPETSANVAMLIQYGHGTRNGGYVPGNDYINPALQSIFDRAPDKLAKEMFK